MEVHQVRLIRGEPALQILICDVTCLPSAVAFMVEIKTRILGYTVAPVVAHGAHEIDIASESSLGELVPDIGSPALLLGYGVSEWH